MHCQQKHQRDHRQNSHKEHDHRIIARDAEPGIRLLGSQREQSDQIPAAAVDKISDAERQHRYVKQPLSDLPVEELPQPHQAHTRPHIFICFPDRYLRLF